MQQSESPPWHWPLWFVGAGAPCPAWALGDKQEQVMMLFAGILLMFPLPGWAQGSEGSAGTVLARPEKNFPPREEALQVFMQYQN